MKQIQFEENACLFKALSDETRLKICYLISKEETSGGDILKQVDITQPTLSYHMKLLCKCGLVTGRKDGTWIKYRVNNKTMKTLGVFIEKLEDKNI